MVHGRTWYMVEHMRYMRYMVEHIEMRKKKKLGNSRTIHNFIRILTADSSTEH